MKRYGAWENIAMNAVDITLLALCLWREARGEGRTGMEAVACVLRNRVNRDKSTYYAEATKRLQFSSLTAPGDPELNLWPLTTDPQWQIALVIAEDMSTNVIADVTLGATLYYADSIAFPATWDRSKVRQTAHIGHHIFFAEVQA
jgi:N-acetylmuramoyl-L-alanine amidase